MFIDRQSSITAKLMWMNMLVSAAALLLACAAFATYEVIAFRRSMVRSLSIQAQIIGSNSASALLFNDPRSAGNTLAALKAAPDIMDAGIFTASGQPFAGYWRHDGRNVLALPAIPKAQTEAHWFKDRSLVLARRIVFQGKLTGTVLIRIDLRQMDERLKSYATIAGVVLAACMAAVLLMSSFFRRTIADPIVRLAETARIISRQKDYSVRIAENANRDEISVLMESFNEMLAQIQARDGALQEAHNELEDRVEERTAQLKGANKELEAFSYSVSHDLRAPLRQVSGFARILSDEYGAQFDAAGQRYLKLIQDGARNMGRLIDDLINMGRIGRQELLRKPTDLNALLQFALKDLRPEIGARPIDLRLGTLPTIECDPGLIKQVFTNLLSNAVKYTRYQEHPVIEVGQTEENGETVIFVRDNGAGFDQKYENKLFGVFQRLHRADEFEGTGVGLATVQRILQNHGGRIWAKGETGKGASFFFTLKAGGHGGENNRMPLNCEVNHDA
ncbi:MAG: ATP-binding protein [Terriglobia bacterium]